MSIVERMREARVSGDFSGLVAAIPYMDTLGLAPELVDGRLEFLPMPTDAHQQLVGFLYLALLTFVQAKPTGVVPFPPLRVRIRPRRVREPDVLFLLDRNKHKRHNQAWDGADLIMEVVSGSPGDRHRDFLDKLADYAAIGVAEYWIVDPAERVVIVHRLEGDAYREDGRYGEGETAASRLLNGFAVDVAALFAEADIVPA